MKNEAMPNDTGKGKNRPYSWRTPVRLSREGYRRKTFVGTENYDVEESIQTRATKIAGEAENRRSTDEAMK